MNNGKTFSSLDGMACSYQCSDQSQFLPGHWQAMVLDFLRPSKTQPIYLKIILITPRIIWSLKFKKKKKKKNGGIVELLILTLNQIIRNEDAYFVVIMNNRLKIISVRCSHLRYRRIFSKIKLLMRGQKLFLPKKLWGGCSKLED